MQLFVIPFFLNIPNLDLHLTNLPVPTQITGHKEQFVTQKPPIDSNAAVDFLNSGISKAMKKDTKGAIADFNQAIKLDPTYVKAYQSRGNLKATLGDRQGSILDFNNASQSDALNYIGAVNRYSQAYMLDKNAVATNLEALQVEIKPQTDSYAYNFQRIDLNTTQFTAVSKQNNLKNYIGFTVLKNEAISMAIVCETNQTNNLSTLIPQVTSFELICPQGTTNPAKLYK